MSASIPISGLSNLSSIKSEDFVALVSSASLTTYRSNVQSFGNWMHDSGSASSSFVSTTSSYANSASFASRALTASNANTASFSFNALSSSFALFALSASNATSSSFTSFALSASSATSSSFASFALSASLAITASRSITSSFAISASYVKQAESASYFYSPALSKAWAQVSWSAAGRPSPHLMENYNISSITYLSTVPATGVYPVVVPSQPLYNDGSPGRPVAITGSISSNSQWNQFAVVFSAPLSSSRYIFIGDGYQPMGAGERVSVMINDFAPSGSARTVNGFTMSIAVDVGVTSWFTPNGIPNGSNQLSFINFVIF